MKKIFSRRSKRHDLIAEFLVESISVRLQSEINTSLKQLLRVQIKATVARFKAELTCIKFTQKTVTIKVVETQQAILDAKAIRAELRKLVTAVVATKSNPAPQIQAALFTTTII
jgi:arginine repressor